MTETLSVAGLLAIIGLGTLLRSIQNGQRIGTFIAEFEAWKKGFLALYESRHRELERRLDNVERNGT